MKTKQCVSLGILLTLALGGMSVYASSTTSDSTTLPEYVVTATRSMKTQLNSPANTVVLTQKQMKQAGYSNVYEAVHQLAQVPTDGYSQDGYDYGAMVSKLNIRGLAQGTLVLLNGNPIDYTNYAVLGGIPIDQVKKIEVVKGSGSVLYGSTAMAGTINIITERPQKSDKVTGSVDAGLGTQRKAGNITINANNITVGYSTEKLKDRYNIEPIGPTGNGQTISVLDKHGDSGYASVKLSPITTLSYSHTNKHNHYIISNYENFVASHQSGHYDTTTNYWNLTMDNHKTGWKASVGWNDLRILSIYDKTIFGKQIAKPYSSSLNKAHSLNIDIHKRLAVRNQKDSLLLGGSFLQNQMSTESYGKETSEDKTTSYSLYQSYEYNPTPAFTAILGLREYHMTPSKYQEQTTKVLPQLQLLYRDSDHSSFYASAGRSYVMPRINYRFGYKEVKINTDLKPQDGWDYEIGYKFDNGKTRLTTDLFYLNVTNKFAWVKEHIAGKAKPISVMKNIESWHNTGLEFNASHKFSPTWTVRSGLTWQSPVATNNGMSYQDAAKILWNTGATYTHGKLVADVNLYLNLKREKAYYDVTRTYKKLNEGYHKNLKNSADLRLALHYMPNADDTISVIGTNLLNRKDVINIYEYEALPRAVFVSYGHKF